LYRLPPTTSCADARPSLLLRVGLVRQGGARSAGGWLPPGQDFAARAILFFSAAHTRPTTGRMIVRVVKIVNPLGGAVAEHPSLRVGADYLVLDIYVNRRSQMIRVLDDEGGIPGTWPIEMFEVRSPRLSSTWGAAIDHYEGGAALHLGPVPWLRPGFWPDYVDRAWEGRGLSSARRSPRWRPKKDCRRWPSARRHLAPH